MQDVQVAVTRVVRSEMDNSENVVAFDRYAKLNNIIERTYHCVVYKKKKKLLHNTRKAHPQADWEDVDTYKYSDYPVSGISPQKHAPSSSSSPAGGVPLLVPAAAASIPPAAPPGLVPVPPPPSQPTLPTLLVWRLVLTPVTLQCCSLLPVPAGQIPRRRLQALPLRPFASAPASTHTQRRPRKTKKPEILEETIQEELEVASQKVTQLTFWACRTGCLLPSPPPDG